MTVIREADVIASVADALQYISYYHTPDFIRAMGRAYEMEQSPSARDAIAQILTNSRMCAEGHRPICQDTGIVVVFVKVGMGVRWEATRDLEVDDQRRRAARLPRIPTTSCARPSCPIPHSSASNTRDNTPAVIHTEFVPGERGRDHRRREGRRLGKQIHVRHAESIRFGGRLGARRWCPRWAPAGVRPECWEWASAAAPRRPCCWRRNR